MSMFLSTQNNLIDKINDYCDKNHLYKKNINLLEDFEFQLNYWRKNDNVYFLSNDHWNMVYKLLNDPTNIEFNEIVLLEKSKHSSHNISNDLKAILESVLNKIKDQKLLYGLLDIVSQSDIKNIIIKYLESKILSNIQKHKSTDTHVYTSFCVELGYLISKYVFRKLSIIEHLVESLQGKHALNPMAVIALKKLLKDCIYDHDNCWEDLKDRYHPLIKDMLKNSCILFFFDLYRDRYPELYEFHQIIDIEFPSNDSLIKKENKIKQANSEIYIRIANDIVNKMIDFNLFEQRKDFDEDKSTWVLEMQTSRSYSILLSASYFRPFLSSTNYDFYDETYNTYNQDFSINIKKNKCSIHNKSYMKASFVDDFHKILLNRETKLSIDTDFLNNFIKYLNTFINNSYWTLSDTQREKAYFFLKQYKVDFIKVCEHFPEQIVDIKDIMTFAIDFNKLYDNVLGERLKQISKNVLYKLYQKICSYKFFFINLLKEAYLYSNFNYFYLAKFADARGRLYSKGYFLNHQTLPIVKAFLKFKVNIKQFQEHYEEILTIFNDSLISNLNITYSVEQYKVLRENLELDSFYSHFNKDTFSHNNFINFIENKNCDFNDNLIIIQEHIKKSDHIFILLSQILLFKTKKYSLTNILEYDATFSGCQQIAILTKSKKLGSFCNLVNKEYVDIYSDFMRNFNKELEEVYKNTTASLKNIEINCMPDLTMQILSTFKSSTLKEIIEIFFKYNIDNYLRKRDFYEIVLLKSLGEDIKPYLLPNYESYEWLITDKDLLKFLKSDQNRYILLINLLIIKSSRIFLKLIEQENWIKPYLRDRSLIKSVLLSYGYGNTVRGRENMFKEAIYDLANKNGVLHIKKTNLLLLISYLESYFNDFKNNQLTKITNIMQIGKLIARKMKKNEQSDFQLKTKYLKISLQTFESQTKILSLYDNKHNRIQLVQNSSSDKFDSRKFAQVFPANFIHMLDATTVHQFMLLIYNINKKLQDLTLECPYITNHDCFSFSSLYFPFLKPILKQVYIQMYNENSIYYLKESCDALDVNLFPSILKYIENSSSSDYLIIDENINPNFCK